MSVDCHKAFALVVRPPTEHNNKLLSFQMTSEEPPKEDWLKTLCRHVANTICKADAVSSLQPCCLEILCSVGLKYRKVKNLLIVDML